MNLDAVIHFRDNILPKVQAQLSDFRMLIAGTLARKVAPLLTNIPNLVIWDELPEIDDFYAAIALATVPLEWGRGPTSHISPASTFSNCGSSSRLTGKEIFTTSSSRIEGPRA